MKELAFVNVPQNLTEAESTVRKNEFEVELRSICKKYQDNGIDYLPGFIFNEQAHMNGADRYLLEFDEKWKIPVEMQIELADAWVKLFRRN